MHPRKASISVVVVTYNRAVLLASTIESLLKQTVSDFELIIADDASSDGTRLLCEQWAERDPRIVYQRREQNVRMPQNLNLAIQSSTGDYVAVLHDDDVYRPDLLEKWASRLDEHKGAGFVFNAYRALDANGATRRIYRESLPPCSPGSYLLEQIFFRRWRFDSPVWGTAMIRRTAFEGVGPYDARFGFWSDVDLYMRLAEDFDVCYVDEDIIWVTSGEVAPHQFRDDPKEVLTTLHRMFWEARMRHYRFRPVRRFWEAIRHIGFLMRGRALIWVRKIKCAVRQRLR